MFRKLLELGIIISCLTHYSASNAATDYTASGLSDSEEQILMVQLRQAVLLSRSNETRIESDRILNQVLGPLSTKDAWTVIRKCEQGMSLSPKELFAQSYPGVDPDWFFGRYIRRRVTESLQLQDIDDES